MDISNEEQQFSTLYKREIDALFRYTAFRVADRDEVLDIVQDVFSALWSQYRIGRSIVNPRAFLYASARNRIIDWYRRAKPASLDQLRNDGDGEELPFEPIDTLAEAQITLGAEAHQALALIEELPLAYRQAVYLRLVEELLPHEIAELTGQSANVISIRISRGLALLRKKLHNNTL